MKRAYAAAVAAVALMVGTAGPVSARDLHRTGQGDGHGNGNGRLPGREHIAMRTVREGGHTRVVPADAQRLIAAGRLDRRLFDVTELSGRAVRDSHGQGLKVIVGYQGAAGAAKADGRETDGTEVRRTLTSLNAKRSAPGTPPTCGPR
ncbi:1,4-dihydropyridine enantioselective esterase [Streptomyces lincolnensis]|uniref:1,4-dihydropyridine enantioselective esterase n=1 Tax=Streptomyces lincolnensis TaxID=1915 RepID=A0A1B1MM91_STRLN|nr:1,4-dihydropyridine enantioselective esterase [Streptomyces lincolnensis]AXG58638.1 1,4-dihydropyridine enantioselective esterase [Streptomyces lincolnensis]QMV11265.1 hypothetical protein GJU35_40035 [Streptomyces lincolnensis]